MQRSELKQKIVLTLFSVFIVWHAIGIGVVAPSHGSHFRESMMKIYGNYLSTFRIHPTWHFYSPNPGRGVLISYETISDSGGRQRYPLSQARHKFNHAYFRYTNFYVYLFSDEDYSARQGYDQSVANYLCRQHEGENVSQIEFVYYSQKVFSPQNYRDGKRALDDEFLSRDATYGPFNCS